MIAYADTGFLISLYGEDANSAVATALLEAKPVFLLTTFGEAEFINAVELRVFRKQWTRSVARAAYADFLHDRAAGVVKTAPFAADVWQASVTLSRRHTAKLGVRTLDVLHVAAAIQLEPDVFFTFDERQRRLARAERLHVLPA